MKKNVVFRLDQIISEFEEDKIETRRLWKPMHMQPIFKNNPFYGNGVSNLLFEKESVYLQGVILRKKTKKELKIN